MTKYENDLNKRSGLPEGPQRNVVLEALGVAVALVDEEVGHGHILLGAFLNNLYSEQYINTNVCISRVFVRVCERERKRNICVMKRDIGREGEIERERECVCVWEREKKSERAKDRN